MSYLKYIKSGMLILLSAGILTTSTVYINEAFAQPAATSIQSTEVNKGIRVSPLTVVNSPKAYLNKTVIMNAKFDKFSMLGLDYKPAFKSSDDYISFLIKRDDTSFNIPLSEMKLFLKRDVAEKFIDLKTNDIIEIKGTVFSDALGDAWVDVNALEILEKAPDETENK